MKLLELRFKNLNSLYGEWIIDFTDPEYVANGIFALIGRTGAGKSTILDAICLALYGATPRLGKITKSKNEIMSRQTGECYAEVLFESQVGRFRCYWGQHRAKKKANGDLQNPRHEISEGTEKGTIIEHQLRRVAIVIEEKTGMDFDRFTRSILLAQGGFDTFLKAKAEKKSEILEQITGTEIYSKISQRVHERQRDEREKLDQLQAEISTISISILQPEQEKENQQTLKAKQEQETELASTSTETDKAIAWLTSINELEKEVLSFGEEAGKLQGDIDAFEPERNQLERGMKAATLDGNYATLTALRTQQADDQTTLKIKEATLPKLKASAQTQAEALKTAEQQTTKAKYNLKAVAPLIHKIRSLDQKIAGQAKAVSEDSETCTKEAAKIETDRQARLKEQEKHTNSEKSLEIAEQYLREHAQDEWLISGLTGIEEQFGNLLAKQKEIAQKKRDCKDADSAVAEASKSLDAATKHCTVRKQELEAAIKDLQQGKEALSELLGDRSLREYRDKKETLLREMAYLEKIEELEDHLGKLEDGKPCPLCGSKEHPFAEGNVPVFDETEDKIGSLDQRIDQAEGLEKTNQTLEKAESSARNNLAKSENLEVIKNSNRENAKNTLTGLKADLERLQTNFERLKLAVSGKLQPLGITEIPESGVSSLRESLRARLKAWQKQIRQKTEIENQITAIDSEMKRLDAVIETKVKALTEKQEDLERLKKERAAGMDEREKQYGDKNPDEEDDRLSQAIADAEEAEKKARKRNTELQQKLTTANTYVRSLKKRIEQEEPYLKKAKTDFSLGLKPAGFSGEKEFLDARLTTEKREAFSAKARKLDKAQTELKTKQKDRQKRLGLERAKKVTDKTLEELEPQLKEYEGSLKELRDTIASLKHKLNENTKAKERIKEKQTIIEEQKKEYQRWNKLHGLIGSADGKKYRNFAQGLTFKLMVSHANRQLEKMTDRYLLIRDDEQPLELNVVDHYQAGEIRSTSNLSGGESFVVSLTLALGLSKMASRKVRVDSLFLDEGFGTLDEEALETALETLSGLQQDGKLIGIISHISALKDRVRTQISITPISGGRSSLAGPGCSKVKNHINYTNNIV